MKKTLCWMVVASLCLGSLGGATVLAGEAREGEEAALKLLEEVKGTYGELFTRICDPMYDQLWLEDCEAIVGEEMGEECAAMLKGACTGRLYGEEAVEAYGDDPESAVFDCFFREDVSKFVFEGSHICGLSENGEELFGYDYDYAGDFSIAGMMDGYLYETQAEDAGEFKYFFLLPDTPKSTYHIEFRYGSDLEALAWYDQGDYAYWLAAGILADADEEMVEKVIALFVEENLAGMGEEPQESQEEFTTLEIGSAQELLDFAKSVSDGSMGGYPLTHVLLTADIDCSDLSWEPIGTMDLEDMSRMDCIFQGFFDGQGHTISNVCFESADPICGAGIFGMSMGEVKNLKVENVQVRCTNDFSMAIGGVVGYNMGTISQVSLSGENEISAVNCTGGICGGNMGTVKDCSVEGTTICVLGDNDFSSGRIIQCDVAECGGLIIGGSFGGSIENCSAQGTVKAAGNEPVGLGGVAGCLEMMDRITGCSADALILTEKGGHAIGGLCGYSGTHSNGNVVADTEGIVTEEYPAIIEDCHVTVNMEVPGATHVGGLVGTGLYYYGEETAFQIENCSVKAEILGAITPGSVAGRAEGSKILSCETEVTLDGEPLTEEVGKTQVMYESADQ